MSKHSARLRRRFILARTTTLAGACALTGLAPAQMVYDPFNYGSAAQSTFLANLTGPPTWSGFTNPSNGQTWFDTFTSAATPAHDVTITPGSLTSVPGLMGPSGDSAGITGADLTGYTARIAVMPNPNNPNNNTAGLVSGTMYYSIRFKVTDMTGLTAAGSFFTGFNNTTGTQTGNPGVAGSRIRVFAVGTNTFNVGANQNNNANDFKAPDLFTVGDEIFAVLSYTYVNGPGGTDDIAKLWLTSNDPNAPGNIGAANFGTSTPPTTTLSGTGTDMSSLASFILREGNNIIPKSITVDELRIDPSWAQVTMPAGNSWIGASGASWSADANWSTGTHPSAASSFVNFMGSGGNVVIDAPQTVGCINIRNTSGYTISGATLTFDSGAGAELGATAINVMAVMDPTGPGIVQSGSHQISAPLVLNNTLSANIASSQTLTLSGSIGGTGGLIKNGAGTLALGTSNSYTGNTTIGDGTLAIGDGNALGSGSITFMGGTLRATANVTVGNPVVISSVGLGTGTVDTGSSLVTMTGTIGGANQSLNKVGSGTLVLSGTGNSYGNTLVRAGTLRISAPNNLGAGANLSLAGGALQTDAAMSLTQNFIVTSAGTIDTHGFNSSLAPGAHITGTGIFHKAGAGVLTTNGVGTVTSGTAGFIGGITVDAGTLAVSSGRDASGKLTHTGALTVATGAALDLNDNDLVYNYSNGGAADPSKLTAVQQLLATGYAGGAWTGTGITSGVAKSIAADNTNTHKTAMGFAEASAAGLSNFDGVTNDGDMIVIRYTYAGDSNLDGQVTSTDFNAVAMNFNQSGQTWIAGDFNYDGKVNALDFNAVASNFGATQINSPALGAVVPEPCAALLSLALPLIARRRRASM